MMMGQDGASRALGRVSRRHSVCSQGWSLRTQGSRLCPRSGSRRLGCAQLCAQRGSIRLCPWPKTEALSWESHLGLSEVSTSSSRLHEASSLGSDPALALSLLSPLSPSRGFGPSWDSRDNEDISPCTPTASLTSRARPMCPPDPLPISTIDRASIQGPLP